MNIENYLSATSYKTRGQLVNETGLSDRKVRSQISELKKKKVVIYSSSRKGYRLAKEINSMSQIELDEETDLIKHCIADINSKKKVYNKQLRKYIAYLKIAEQRKNAMILEKENG